MAQLKKRFEQLQQAQKSFLERAREASSLTIPQLFPPEGSNKNTKYPTPYQSIGARGVNNLANKIVLSLFPPNTNFFILDLPESDKGEMGVSDGMIRNKLIIVEKSLINEMEVTQLRSFLVEVAKQGIVGGSSLLYVPDEGFPEVYSLDEFGVKRDRSGNLLELIIRDKISFIMLDDGVKEQINHVLSDKERQGEKDLEIYTMVRREGKDLFHVFQEVKGITIEGTEGFYTEDDLPYIYVPFVDRGEQLGRSYIEDFIGDLQSYESLRQSLLEGAAESSRIIYILSPNSMIQAKDLETAQSGDVLMGNPDDVSTLQADKRLDMAVTQKEAADLKQDLSLIFLLDSAVRRDAERVTAEEIRQVSQELEVALGGIYSTLANKVQRPLVKRYMARLIAQGKLPEIIKDSSLVEITTGNAALGRGTDFQTLTTFVGTLQNSIPEAYQYLHLDELISRLAGSLDVKTADLVKTENELREEQAAQQAAIMEQQAQMAELENSQQEDLKNRLE